MKILILSWRGPGHPLAGGAELVTSSHAEAWVKAGHEVTLFTSYFSNAKRFDTVRGVQIMRQGNDVFGVQICAWYWYVFENKLHFDLVVDEFHGIPFFTPLYAHTKRLAFIHEIAQNVWSSNPWPKPFNLIPWFVGKYGEPLVFKLFYRSIPFMTVSESTKQDLIKMGIKSVTVVQNGISIKPESAHVAKEKVFTLLFLSALAKDKGIEDALTLFNSLAKSNREFQFWVAGKGASGYVSKLQRLASPSIKFWGYVSEDKKIELLSKAHVLINCSVHEGWGLTNIEANLCRTPVVGYRVSGTVDSVADGKTGILVTKHDINALAKEVIRLKTNSALYMEFQNNALAWAKRFTWGKSTNNSLKLITSLHE